MRSLIYKYFYFLKARKHFLSGSILELDCTATDDGQISKLNTLKLFAHGFAHSHALNDSEFCFKNVWSKLFSTIEWNEWTHSTLAKETSMNWRSSDSTRSAKQRSSVRTVWDNRCQAFKRVVFKFLHLSRANAYTISVAYKVLPAICREKY